MMEYSGTVLLLLFAALAIGIAAGVVLRKKLVEENQKNIALQGRQIIENAINEAEQIKKEGVLQAKEEALLLKQEADKEIKISRQELKDDQRRLNRKADELQRESELIEERQGNLDKRQETLQKNEKLTEEKNIQLTDVLEAQRYKLEKI